MVCPYPRSSGSLKANNETLMLKTFNNWRQVCVATVVPAQLLFFLIKHISEKRSNNLRAKTVKHLINTCVLTDGERKTKKLVFTNPHDILNKQKAESLWSETYAHFTASWDTQKSQWNHESPLPSLTQDLCSHFGEYEHYVGNINQPILERGIGTNTHLSQKMAQTGAYRWDYMCIQWLCWLQQSIWNFYNAV